MLVISVFQLSFLAGSTGPVGAHKLLGPERPLEVSYGTMSALNPNALPPLIAEAADQKVTPERARERWAASPQPRMSASLVQDGVSRP